MNLAHRAVGLLGFTQAQNAHILFPVYPPDIRKSILQHHLVDRRVEAVIRGIGLFKMDDSGVAVEFRPQRECRQLAVNPDAAAADIEPVNLPEELAHCQVVSATQIEAVDLLFIAPGLNQGHSFRLMVLTNRLVGKVRI